MFPHADVFVQGKYLEVEPLGYVVNPSSSSIGLPVFQSGFSCFHAHLVWFVTYICPNLLFQTLLLIFVNLKECELAL